MRTAGVSDMRGKVMSDRNDILDRVLIVDDDPIFCAIVEAHLMKRGAGIVFIAGDGKQALDLLDGGVLPSYIVCDLNMPNMDGIEFLRYLESVDFPGAVTIVSGESASVVSVAERIAETHSLKIAGALKKPLKVDQLDSLIAEASQHDAEPDATPSTLVSVSDLRDAILNRGIATYYQPKVDARTGQVCGVEALARWEHPELGMIYPSVFIPVAEQHGLIDMLTAVVLQTAIVDVWRWRKAGTNLECSINLSVQTLEDIEFPDKVTACVDAAELDHSSIVFEVTESSILRKEAVTMEVLARLRLKGFGLSIDDFGTGNSNFEQLRDFPFSELKIDRSFVSKMLEQPFASQCVVTSIQLGKKLGLRLVAEGIETEEMRDAVAELGVDHLQGYFFGEPMPAGEFETWLAEYNRKSTVRQRQLDQKTQAMRLRAS